MRFSYIARFFQREPVVNGVNLPQLLITLMKEKRWKRPQNISLLAKVTGISKPRDLVFLDLTHMRRETDGLRRLLDGGFGEFYGLASSRRLSRPVTDPQFLDVDLAVCIAVDWSDNILCLDFRHGAPCVAATTRVDKLTRWKVIAPSFDEFVEQLELTSQP